MNYLVTAKGYISDLLLDSSRRLDIQKFTLEELTHNHTLFSQGDALYVPSEMALQEVLKHLNDRTKSLAIQSLKNKFAFRMLLKEYYPDFYFAKTSLKRLSDLSLAPNKEYVVKPEKGFFGAGVHIVNKKTDLNSLRETITKELQKNAKYFSEDVLSQNDLLVEEFVEGEEYAVDMYYNNQGKPIIMNIYSHPFPKYPAYSNVLYYTDKVIFDKLYEKIIDFFTKLSNTLTMHSFPIHAEFKLTSKNMLIPIELNPLRFGGMGLADLSYYACGFNPFEAFFTNFEPSWDRIWKERKGKHFAWVLAYNGTRINTATNQPNHEKFKNYLGNILHYYAFDYKENPVFASAYIQASAQKLQNILKLDFNKYFTKNN